jgi:hypothetical protein
MPVNVTLLELVHAVMSFARSDEETVATIVHLVNSGPGRLCGTFRGARFRLEDAAGPAAASSPRGTCATCGTIPSARS